MKTLDERSARCLVFTYKEGVLSAVAHDLKIEVTRFAIDVDEVERTVEGRFDATSLRVVCAMQNGAEAPQLLGDARKREIEENIARHVLDSRRYPEVRYASASVVSEGDGFRVSGTLSLHGKEAPVEVVVRKENARYVATARVHQTDFGIRPYSALLGTLKVKNDVAIEIAVPWPGGSAAPQ